MLLLRQTRGLTALFILSFSSLFLVILVVLYLPANLIQSPACLLSLGSSDSSVLSGACFSDLRNNGFDEDGVLVIGGVDSYEKEGDNDDEGVGAVGAGEAVVEFELESGLDPGTGYRIEAGAEAEAEHLGRVPYWLSMKRYWKALLGTGGTWSVQALCLMRLPIVSHMSLKQVPL